jgi:hypothetical protein
VSEQKEQVVLETLTELPKKNIVLVGGYAVNAYAPPRFSVDCDLVVLRGVEEVEKALKQRGFRKEASSEASRGGFVRYSSKDNGISFDLLVGSLVDNQTGVVFEGKLFEKHSAERRVVGRMTVSIVTMRVADPELLFATKFVPARRQDARDMFMLSGTQLNWRLAEQLIREKCSATLIKGRVSLVRGIIDARQFRDSLQGAYGRIPDERYARCKKNLDSFFSGLVRHRRKNETPSTHTPLVPATRSTATSSFQRNSLTISCRS